MIASALSAKLAKLAGQIPDTTRLSLLRPWYARIPMGGSWSVLLLMWINLVRATINGLRDMHDPEYIAAKRGKSVEDILG